MPQVADFGISSWQGQVPPDMQYSGVQPPEEAHLAHGAYPDKVGHRAWGSVPFSNQRSATWMPHR